MRTAWIVAALTLATLALRLWGIDHCLPHWHEADANLALHAELLRKGATDPDPQHNDAQYPIVLAGTLSLLPSCESAPASRATLADHLRAAASIFVETRTEIALLGTLLVPLTFLFARRFLSARWSLFAAALIATSFLHEFFAQQARPHAAAAAFFLLTVLASMRLAREPSWRNYALAALACALSIGVLQSGLATLVTFFAAMFVAPLLVVHESAQRLYARLTVAFLLVVAVAATSVLVFYPYLFHQGREATYGRPVIDGSVLVWGDHRLDLHDWQGLGFLRVAWTLWSYEPVLLALLVLAAFAFVRRKRSLHRPLSRWSDFWVAAAFALPYLVAIGLFRNTFERFSMPLLPFYATFAAWGLESWSARWGAIGKRAFAALAVCALVASACACVQLARLRSRDDTLERTAAWIAEQSDAVATPIYVTPFFDLPLARSRDSLQPPDKHPAAILSRWSVYQKRLGPDVVPPPRYDLRYLVPRPDLGFPQRTLEGDAAGYVKALGPGYFVLDMSRQVEHASFGELRAAVRARGKLVHREAPEDAGPNSVFGFPFEDEILPDWPAAFARTFAISAVGPVVEVYRID